MNSRLMLWAITTALLSACATVRMFDTSGPVARPLANTPVRVTYEPFDQTQITISKQGLEKINDVDKSRAFASATALNKLFADSLRTRFPADAAQQGLVMARDGEPAAHLRISVMSFTAAACDAAGCLSRVRLAGELTDVRGERVWKFVSSTGAPNVFQKELTPEIFDGFEKALFENMRADGVLAAPGGSAAQNRAGPDRSNRLVELPPLPPIPSGKSRVVLVCDAREWVVQLDGRTVGKIKAGEYALLSVDPGSHRLATGRLNMLAELLPDHQHSPEFSTAAQQTIYILVTAQGTAPIPSDFAAKKLAESHELHLGE